MAKKSSKSIPQSSKAITPLSKMSGWNDYMSDNSMYHFPEKDDWRRRVIYSIYEWVDNDDSLEMMQFCMEYKIKYDTMTGWRKKYSDIDAAWDDAKRMIGCRRRLGAMKRKLDGAYAYRDMHVYDPEWKQVDQYHKELKIDESSKNQKVIVELRDLTKLEETNDASRDSSKTEQV